MTDTVESLVAYCRENGRVCPQPTLWNELWEMLPDRRRVGSGWEPPVLLILTAWHTTPAPVPADGKVYVCVNDEECLIKIVRSTGGKIFLESINREYPLFPASVDFKVEGEVRTVISGKF